MEADLTAVCSQCGHLLASHGPDGCFVNVAEDQANHLTCSCSVPGLQGALFDEAVS